jgi:hypothetical protein
MGHVSCQIMGCVYCANLLAGKLNAPPQSVIRASCASAIRAVRSGFVARQEHNNRRTDEFTSSLNHAHGGAWVCVWALGLAWV